MLESIKVRKVMVVVTLIVMALFLYKESSIDPIKQQEYDSLRYGTEFIVNDDFYGEGYCLVDSKFFVKSLNREYFVKGICQYDSSVRDMTYSLEAITIVE